MASGVGNLLAEYLKSPDDLAKIPSLQRKLAREHASLSAKLKMGAKDQLEMTREGLLQLHSTRREIAGVQEKFAQIENMFQDTSDGAHGETRGARSFRVISELSRLRRTLVQTTDLLTRFETMTQDVKKLSEVLAQYRADLLGPAPELLALHFQLAKWETFRNETLHLAGSSAPDAREQLMSMLTPLEELLDGFEAYMLALFVNVLALVQRGQNSVVVRMVKIMERENREDERTAAIRLAKHAKIEGAARLHGIATYGHSIKLYWHKFRESLQMSALRRLQETWTQLAEPSPRALYEQSSWLYDELEQVRRSVVPLFPAEVQVHKIYVQAHHRALGELLQTEVPLEEADAASLLELYHVAQEHEARLTRDGQGIDASWLEPSLLGGREQSIIDDYASLLTRKMDDWTANLMYGEIAAFVQREKAPDETAEGMYLSLIHI